MKLTPATLDRIARLPRREDAPEPTPERRQSPDNGRWVVIGQSNKADWDRLVRIRGEFSGEQRVVQKKTFDQCFLRC